MNEYIGETSRSPDPRETYYYKPDDFVRPGAANTWLLLDEHEDSINDGFFLIGGQDSTPLGFNSVPAWRHTRGCDFAFVDGHVERHKWLDPRTCWPVTRKLLVAPPQPNSADVEWVFDHATAPK